MLPSDPDAIIRSMREASVRRLAQADAEERQSIMAYRAGQFEEYWLNRGKEAEARVEAENERLAAESNAEGGIGGEDWGGEPDDSVPQDDGDIAQPPPEEELPSPD